eukprot:1834402-Pyramimonas_sp.AAC.1
MLSRPRRLVPVAGICSLGRSDRTAVNEPSRSRSLSLGSSILLPSIRGRLSSGAGKWDERPVRSATSARRRQRDDGASACVVRARLRASRCYRESSRIARQPLGDRAARNVTRVGHRGGAQRGGDGGGGAGRRVPDGPGEQRPGDGDQHAHLRVRHHGADADAEQHLAPAHQRGARSRHGDAERARAVAGAIRLHPRGVHAVRAGAGPPRKKPIEVILHLLVRSSPGRCVRPRRYWRRRTRKRLSKASEVSDTLYTFAATPTSNTNLSVTLDTNVLLDYAGNANDQAAVLEREYDTVLPSAALATATG